MDDQTTSRLGLTAYIQCSADLPRWTNDVIVEVRPMKDLVIARPFS